MLDEKLLMELQEYVEKHLERLGYVLYEPVRYDSIDTLDTELDVRCCLSLNLTLQFSPPITEEL